MKKQSGFTAIEIVMALVIVSLIGVVSWQAVKGHQKATSNTSTTSVTASPSGAAASDFLKIPELGVKLALSASIKDAYYSMQTVNGQPIAYMSLRSLDAIDANCAADKSSTAAVTYFTDPNAPGGETGQETNAQANPDAVKINGKYFFVALSNGECTGNATYQSEIISVRDAFHSAKISAL